MVTQRRVGTATTVRDAGHRHLLDDAPSAGWHEHGMGQDITERKRAGRGAALATNGVSTRSHHFLPQMPLSIWLSNLRAIPGFLSVKLVFLEDHRRLSPAVVGKNGERGDPGAFLTQMARKYRQHQKFSSHWEETFRLPDRTVDWGKSASCAIFDDSVTRTNCWIGSQYHRAARR